MANEVEIRIVTDTANADAQLNKLKGTTGGLNKNLLTSAKRFAVMGTAVAGAAVGVGLATKKIFDMAANLELVENKINIVFGDQVGMVNDWADNVSKRMGLSSTQVAGLAANFADLLIPMQFTREQAAEMSTDIVGLSGALAEWSGGTRSAAEVADILGKAMLGEREAIKSLGISITEADVKNKILSMSTQELSGLTTAQAKAIATRDLILEKSVDAQNAYKENTDGLSVAQANLTSAIETVKEEFVKELTPILMDLAKYLQEEFIPMIEKDLIPNLDKIAGFITLSVKAFKLLKPAMLATPFEETAKRQKEAAEATKEQREMLDKVNSAYLDVSDAALGINQIIPLTNEEISQQNRELEAQRKMLAEANQGYFDFSDAALGVETSIHHASDALTRFTAEQYAASVAAQILSSSFADQIEFDDMFDTAVENLRKLVGQEGQLAALKRELLELAGIDFDFRSSKTERESGKTTTQKQTTADTSTLVLDDTMLPDLDPQKLSADQIIQDEIARGFLRFQFDFDKMFGGEGMGSAGIRITTKAANTLTEDLHGVLEGNTIGDAITRAFDQISSQFGLGENARAALAESFEAQAKQQDILFGDMGVAVQANQQRGFFTTGPDQPRPSGTDIPRYTPPPAVTINVNAAVIADKQEVGNAVAGVIVESDAYKSGQLSLGTP